MYFISSRCRTWRQKGQGVGDDRDFCWQAANKLAIGLDIKFGSGLRLRVGVVTRRPRAIGEFNSRNSPRPPQQAASHVSKIREPIACLTKDEPDVVSIQRRTRRQLANNTP